LVLKKCKETIEKMPRTARERLVLLVDDISDSGPVQKQYMNYSKLGENTYHCHLTYHWVACWRNENGSLLVEVYYVGSRENAPY